MPTIRVLVVCDGYPGDFSFSKVPSKSDAEFTLTQFVTALRGYNSNISGVGFETLRFQVTLAHRDDDLGVNGAAPGEPNLLAGTIVNSWFTWEGSPPPPSGKNGVDLSQFDVIYLFGFNTEADAKAVSPPDLLCWDGASNEDQLWAFVEFMQTGGGIFATGDHEDKGAPLCGSIPRVRSMRRWWWDTTNSINSKYKTDEEGPYGGWNYGIEFVFSVIVSHDFNRSPYDLLSLGDLCAPPAVGPYRMDTVQPGPTGWETIYDPNARSNETGVPFDRQSDDIPQPLKVTTKHPILALSNNRYLSFLPDHMHEGVVIGSGDLDQWGQMAGAAKQTYEHNGKTIQEYPKTPGGQQPLPAVIAQVESLYHPTPSGEIQHIGALDWSFDMWHGAISVYDGRSAGVGRVVTQTSFHHFIDINLIGDPATQVPGGTNRTGFTTAAGKPYLADFESYWFNLTIWLAPAQLKLRIILGALDQARRNSSIRAVYRPDMKLSGQAVHSIGQMVAQHLDAQLPAPMLQDLVECALDQVHRERIAAVFKHRARAVPQVAGQLQRTFLHGFLGGAILHAMEYPAATSFQAQADLIGPHFVLAGLQGARRSLAASPHRAVVSDLVDMLQKFGADPSPRTRGKNLGGRESLAPKTIVERRKPSKRQGKHQE